MLQVKATRIRLRGDLVKRDPGKVDILSVPDPLSVAPARTDGPSIPDLVDHPLIDAAPNTNRSNPIAASYFHFPKTHEFTNYLKFQ